MLRDFRGEQEAGKHEVHMCIGTSPDVYQAGFEPDQESH